MKKLILLILLLFSFTTYSQEFRHMRISKKKMFVSRVINQDSIRIDTNLLKNLLIQKNLYDKFQNGNLDSVDKKEFNHCFNQSIILESSMVKVIPIIEYTPKPISHEVKSLLIQPPVIEPTATLTYVISDTMLIGKTYTIDLTLSKDLSQQVLVKIIDGFKNKELIDTLITITPTMRARLLDPGNCFKQEPITSEIQNTTGRNLIRWQWQVIPQTEGEISLTISVDNYVDNIPQNINIYNGKTYVYAIHTWYGDFGNWLSKYWDKITYVLGGLIALLGWLYKEKIINIFKKDKLSD